MPDPGSAFGCSCGTAGYTNLLACGHHLWTHGQPSPGTWITCRPCNGQRKVKRSEAAGA